jgi:hypothetical protein
LLNVAKPSTVNAPAAETLEANVAALVTYNVDPNVVAPSASSVPVKSPFTA